MKRWCSAGMVWLWVGLLAASVAQAQPAPRPVNHSTLPADTWEIQFALGAAHEHFRGYPDATQWWSAVLFRGAYAIDDRWQWNVQGASFAYRGGERGSIETIPWGGLLSWGLGLGDLEGWSFQGVVGLGGDLRVWLGHWQSLVVNAGIRSGFGYSTRTPMGHRFTQDSDGEWVRSDMLEPLRRPPHFDAPFRNWRAGITLGTTHTLGRHLTLAFGARFDRYLLTHGQLAQQPRPARAALSIGSVLAVGLRPLPLVRVHVSDVVSIDGYAQLTYHYLQTRVIEQEYLAGLTFTW